MGTGHCVGAILIKTRVAVNMSVISYIDSRRLHAYLNEASLDFEQLSDCIDKICPQFVCLGAVMLLRTIVLLSKLGESHCSYTEVCKRLGISRTSMAKYLYELEDHKLLKIRRSRTGKQNASNTFEINFNGPLGAAMSNLKIPKSAKIYDLNEARNKRDFAGENGSSKELGVVQKMDGYTTYIDNTNILTKVSRAASRPAFDTVEEAVAATAKRTVRKRQEKVEKQATATTQNRGGHLTHAGVKATWATAMLKHYPSVPAVAITAKDFAMMKYKLAPILEVANLLEFFMWVVGSWSTLRATKFEWLNSKGKFVAPAPSLPELMRYWKVFAQAFADSRMLTAAEDSRKQVSEDDRTAMALQQAQAGRAKAEQELAKTQERLHRAEAAAYGVRKERPKRQRSLSERERVLGEQIDDGTLPEWSE